MSSSASIRTLSALRPGSRAVIVDFAGRGDTGASLSRRMMEMGMTVGAEIEIAHEAPFGGAIAVRCRGSLIALRLVDAEMVEVEALS